MKYFNYVTKWLRKERAYQMKKFSENEDDNHTSAFSETDPTWWIEQITMYLYRAQVLSLENPNGRQALAKATATCVGFLESTVRVYGELPQPGVSSGDNLDNLQEF